ncbi:hypothetical protein K4K57_008714 [Colletotrichum sp. SAR 10_99]|nr:hypothetical protein K4K56_007571 [Colletotrichum sp. SAR 10_98]KAJ5009471.1 hypothetical protein K4K57_008714 [Colletotrichum sp. SAR 10_99]
MFRSFLNSIFPGSQTPPESTIANSASPDESGQRVTGSTWDVHPISHPATAPWHLNLSDTDTDKLLHGYQPAAMEDRWMCRSDGPDEQGNIVVHVYRSWTGNEQFQMKVTAPSLCGTARRESEAKKSGENDAEITEITWDTGSGDTQMSEEDAKSLATTICKRMQLSTLIPVVALGISAVSAEYCTQALDPYPRKASTGFRFESVDANNWKWTSRDVQVVTTVSPQGGNCQIHQGGGGGEFSATICIDFKGNYACWVAPSKNQVCDMVFEQDEAPVDVCGNIKNIWGWVA